MKFYHASTTPRPVRLSQSTRTFAERSLDGVYGREAREHPAVTLDDVADWEKLTAQQRYDIAVRRIVEQAPVRITQQELVCGAATLGAAIGHTVPATRGGQIVMESVSHLTLGFHTALRHGINDYERRIRARLGDADLTEKQRGVLEGMLNIIDCMHIWHNRYMEALQTSGNPHAAQIRENLAHVPFEAPRNFRQAVQALWFLFSFERLMGNWPGIGRIDEMLGSYLDADLASGAITIDEAREYIASFIIKGCEWITGEQNAGSGDAQHYQNIIIGGIDENGKDICCEVTCLLLEVLEELPISDFPVALRLNAQTPQRVLQLVSSNVRHGGGVMAVYNEQLVLDALEHFGYDPAVARGFTNDGCWEVQIPGETNFTYVPFDAYYLLQHNVLRLDALKTEQKPYGQTARVDDGEEDVDYPDYESLEAAWVRALTEKLDELQGWFDSTLGQENVMPTSAIDLLEEDCIGRACSYFDGGTRYTVRSPHIGGFSDVVDSLYVIKKLVYEEQKVTLSQLRTILKNDWNDAEDLRRYVRNTYKLFGNDEEEIDALAVHLFAIYLDLNDRVRERAGVLRPAGASTFGRQIEWAAARGAAAHGFKAGTYLASNLGPTPDTDTEGVSAVIRSHCKLPLERLTNGTALDIKLDTNLLTDERYESLLTGLMKGFCDLGGFFMQMDTVDNRILLEAQKNPDAHRNLSVRVAGWSARFVTLNKAWQDMIIKRTTQTH